MSEEFDIPRNPEDKKAIRDAIYEISGAKQFIKDKNSLINDIKKDLKERYNIPNKVISQMVKAHHDNCYEEIENEAHMFEILYETIMKSRTSGSGEEEDVEEE